MQNQNSELMKTTFTLDSVINFRLKLLFLLSIFSLNVGSMTIPMNGKSWFYTPYKKKQSHLISYENDVMIIDVKKSAGVLVHRLAKPMEVGKIKISAEFKGHLKLKKKLQGKKGNDDFILRIGLIHAGKEKLGKMKRLFAPRWIKDLYSNFEPDQGLDKIVFYTFYSDKRLEGKSRIHPNSKLIEEVYVNEMKSPLDDEFTTNSKAKIIGLWIASDGDDSNSIFTLKVKKLEVFP